MIVEHETASRSTCLVIEAALDERQTGFAAALRTEPYVVGELRFRLELEPSTSRPAVPVKN